MESSFSVVCGVMLTFLVIKPPEKDPIEAARRLLTAVMETHHMQRTYCDQNCDTFLFLPSA